MAYLYTFTSRREKQSPLQVKIETTLKFISVKLSIALLQDLFKSRVSKMIVSSSQVHCTRAISYRLSLLAISNFVFFFFEPLCVMWYEIFVPKILSDWNYPDLIGYICTKDESQSSDGLYKHCTTEFLTNVYSRWVITAHKLFFSWFIMCK